MIRFTFGVFLFTGLLFFVAGIQTWAFIQSERALVTPLEAKFAKWPIPIGSVPLEIAITFKNIGKSNAIFEEMAVAISDGLFPTPRYDHSNKVTVLPLAAGTERQVQSYFGEGVGPQFISDLQSGQKKFYFYGRVLYWDDYSFGLFGPKESRFCYTFRPQSADGGHNLDTCREREYIKAK